MSRMFFFGFGHVASILARRLREEGWDMAGTTRTQDKVNAMWGQGVEPHVWDGESPLEAPMRILKGTTHILHSIPQHQEGDRVILHHQKLLKALAPKLEWFGYISSITVYGDSKGEWIKEDYEPNPSLIRGQMRLRVEKTLKRVGKPCALPIHIFRSGAIYGPGRNVIQRMASGKAKRLKKDGHFISRIHAEDLAGTIYASIKKPNPVSIYNVVDDLPSEMDAPADYVVQKLGLPAPPVVDVVDKLDQFPPQMASLFKENRRVNNDLIKSELGYELKYPTFKEGYDELIDAYVAEQGDTPNKDDT